jgi:hypothetical protein
MIIMKTLSIKLSIFTLAIALFASLSPAQAQVGHLAKAMINQLESVQAPPVHRLTGEQASKWYTKLPDNARQSLQLMGITEQNVVQTFEGMSATLQQQIMMAVDPSRQQLINVVKQQSLQIDQKVDQWGKNAGNYIGELFKN